MVDPQKVAKVETRELGLGLLHGAQLSRWPPEGVEVMQRDNLSHYTTAGQVQGAEPVARPGHTSESGDRIMAAGSVQPASP